MTGNGIPTVRSSERAAFGRCPQLWWWAYRCGLTPLGETADALWLGLGVHEAMAQWYKKGRKRGVKPADFFEMWAGDEMRTIRASAEEWEEAKYVDAVELGVAMLENYINEYGKDDHWDVISTEHPFKVRVIREGQPVAYYASRWDGVYRDLEDGEIKIMEHKTAAAINTAYLELDPQGGTYWAVASHVLRAEGVLAAGEHIAEITYNFLRKSAGDDRPRDGQGRYLNQDGSVSKRQPAPLFLRHPVERTPGEEMTELDSLADEVVVMNAMRTGLIPVTKNRTKDCPWCQFFDMCKLHQKGNNNWLELKDSLYYVKDPYAENRKAAL